MESSTNKITVDWEALFKPIEGLKTDTGNIVSINREVVPIIFVPGIMGSRLKNNDGDKVWDPDDIWFMVNRYGRWDATAKKRKALVIGGSFNTDRLVVLEDDTSHNNKNFGDSSDKTQDKRGWGGISWSSYGPFIKALQQRDFNQAWGEPVRHCFEFPVHAFGYNWTASNRDSGSRLKDYIDRVIDHYQRQNRRCEQVILVTHSMGGLVARSACMLHGAKDKVLGVVHGVQPTTGAAAAYWRMKGGFERPSDAPKGEGWAWLRSPLKYVEKKLAGRIAAWTLGTDGEEVTALLGNMPGGLELLPNPWYTDNNGDKAWLKFPDVDGVTVVSLPKRDVYEEIYLEKTAFYRLVNQEWLAPGERASNTWNEVKDPWNQYKTHLKTARFFHEDLKDQTHSDTYQFYSQGLPTVDRIRFDRHMHNWKTKAKRLLGIIKADLPDRSATTAAKAALGLGFDPVTFIVSGATVTWIKDTDWMANRGGCRAYTDASDQEVAGSHDDALFVMTLQRPDNNPVGPVDIDPDEAEESGGDGTVPVSSGAALSVIESVNIGKGDESYLYRDHEPIYKTETARHIAFAAIENLCLNKIRKVAGKAT